MACISDNNDEILFLAIPIAYVMVHSHLRFIRRELLRELFT